MVKEAKDRAEDLEDRLRRNNILIGGLSERVEGKNPTEFVESWFLEPSAESDDQVTKLPITDLRNKTSFFIKGEWRVISGWMDGE